MGVEPHTPAVALRLARDEVDLAHCRVRRTLDSRGDDPAPYRIIQAIAQLEAARAELIKIALDTA